MALASAAPLPTPNATAPQTPPAKSPPHSSTAYWLALLAAILAIKGAIFTLDHSPMFFLGDSEAYLSTATSQWIPPDRSFVYGWIIRALAVSAHSLTPLLIAQTLASALAALLCAVILKNYFAASSAVAAGVALLCALEPLQLLYERYVMCEAFSLLLFAAFTALAIGYLHHPTWPRILAMQILGVLLITLRVSFLPLVQAATLLLPLMLLFNREQRRTIRLPRIAAHLALSLFVFFALHTSYKHLYAAIIQRELPGAGPAYCYTSGCHMLAFVAPLVQSEDFPDPDKASTILHSLAFDLKDFKSRSDQRWAPGGLIDRIKAAYPDDLEAERVAGETASHALKRDPLGELSLTMTGFADYWNLDRLRAGLITDRGSDRDISPQLLGRLERDFNLSADALPHISTLTNRYFFAAWSWYLALMLLPLPALLAIWLFPSPDRPAAFLLFVFAAIQIIMISAFSMGPTVRYLQPVAWLAMISLGMFLSRIKARSAWSGN